MPCDAYEPFEGKGTARLLDDFVCIKVDWEERPDIDAVYMSVCHALTGSGGWPLTVFMTPEQKPFFAGTYFPRTSQYGRLGLQELLRQITRLWRSGRKKLFEAGNQITAAIQAVQPQAAGAPSRDLLREGYHMLRHSYAVASIMSGDNIKTVQENLGHATAAFSLDRYAHVTEHMKKASLERMEAFIRAVSGNQ